MTDDSYHMPTCIGIDIGISIGKIFSSVLGIESIGKKWYRSTFSYNTPRNKSIDLLQRFIARVGIKCTCSGKVMPVWGWLLE